MATLFLHGRTSGVLERAVRALVRELRPQWTVELAAHDQHHFAGPCDSLRLSFSGKDAWIAVVPANTDVSAAATVLDAGARAVVSLDSELAHLEAALAVLEDGGDPYISPGITRSFAREALAQRGQSEASAALTARESEVLDLLASGHSNQEIANRLALSVNTVRVHVQSLSVKLHASSRARLVATARLVDRGQLRGRPPDSPGLAL